ncbi:MAG: BMP family ABC transporter substrate-binding protein, partial [Ilumatobacteraceae bacterium]
MRKKTSRLVALALVTAVGGSLVACGGDDSGSTETTAAMSSESSSSESAGSTFSMPNFDSWESLGMGDSPVVDCRPDSGPLKAAWVYVGPINDGGWTTAHNKGREAVQAEFGDSIETTYKENVPEGPQVAQVIEDLIADGNTLIFGTSFGFQDAFVEAAANHPDVCFEFATGYIPAPNLSQFTGAAEDAAWLTGMAAGAASKTGQLGLLASFPIPEVLRGINAWTLGARETYPGAEVQLIWTNTWFDPARERKTAEILIAEGADVVGVVAQDSPASGEAANEAGIPWSGYDSDQSENFPDIWLSAATYDWSVYEIPRVRAVLEGNWIAGNYYGDMADGHIV